MSTNKLADPAKSRRATTPTRKIVLSGLALVLLGFVGGVLVDRDALISREGAPRLAPKEGSKEDSPGVKLFQEGLCVRNSAFDAFVKGDARLERNLLNHIKIKVTPLSGRGVICQVDGEIAHSDLKTSANRLEPFSRFLIVANTGEGAFVSQEFAKALASAPVNSDSEQTQQ